MFLILYQNILRRQSGTSGTLCRKQKNYFAKVQAAIVNIVGSFGYY